MKKIAILGNRDKPSVLKTVAELRDWLGRQGEVILDAVSEPAPSPGPAGQADLICCFGGDGTILSVIHQLTGPLPPIMGINLGKLGYLAEFSAEELPELLPAVLAGKVPISERMMLRCSVERSSGAGFCREAANDVVIAAGPPFRMIELEVVVGGEALSRITGDGMIVSTPTGSTAYNLSAGGPIVTGDVQVHVLTPICPHSLTFRPLVIAPDRTIEIRVVRANEGTTCSVDGQISTALSENDVVQITRAERQLKLVENPKRTVWDALSEKLHWGHPLRPPA